MLVTAVLVCGLAATGRAAGQANVSVDWPTFLARADPIWTQVPQAWHEAGFVGNGRLGGLVRAAADGVSLQLDVGSSAVWDDRQPGGPHSYTPDNNNCNRPRLPLGALVLDGFSMDPTSFQMRLGLWDAEVTGTAADIDAADGAIAWRVFAHAVYSAADVLVATVTHTSTTAVDVPTWRFNPAVAAMPWAQRACHGLVPNPPVANTTSNVDGVQVFTQAHLSGTEHATAILTVTNQSTHNGVVTTTTVLYVSTSAVLPHGVGASTALDAVRTAAGLGVEALTAAHRVWWHEYYPSGGFITLANPKIESFYWCQMYKVASATRADRELYDLMGPWGVQPTSWPDVHWDLNLQLTYWVFFTSNRVELARSLTSRLAAAASTFVQNVPPEWRHDSAAGPSTSSAPDFRMSCDTIPGESYNNTCVVAAGDKPVVTGNLLWALQQWHNVYRYTGYPLLELESLFPLLANAVTYYSHIAVSDGGSSPLHLNSTVSPEYGPAPDCNYDLSLLRWGLDAVLDAAARGVPAATADPRLGLWRQMSARLAWYSTDVPTGFLIGAGVPLAHGHRHFSHLLMLFPLKQLDLRNESQRGLAARSLDHWMGLGELHGFSYTAASPMNVLLGRKDQAFGNLTFLLDTYITANTMYFEGKEYPCGETPPAAASALADWMLMEEQGVLRVFAGIADGLVTDAAFSDLLAPGGFEVTAVRRDSATSFVEVTNSAGVGPPAVSTLPLLVDAMPLPWTALPSSVRLTPRNDGSGVVEIDLTTLPANATVTLFSTAARPESFAVVPSSGGNQSERNYWGLPLGGVPPPPPPSPPPPPGSQCHSGTPCAAHFSVSGSGCCTYPDAVCCPNGMTCCPKGTVCVDVQWQSTCVGPPPQKNSTGLPICKPGAALPFSTTHPNVLIIGDSVSIGYTPKVAAAMAGEALVQHSPYDVRDGGAEETAYGVLCLDYMLRSPAGNRLAPDVIMFNWGLHDGPLQNSTSPGQYGLPAVYAAELENITVQLKAAQPQAKLLFALTSAFMCSATSDGCVVNLNNQAAAIMAKHNIPTINLHDAIVGQCGTPPVAKCFNQTGCFCPHCPQANGVGYEYLATNVIVPAIKRLLPSAP